MGHKSSICYLNNRTNIKQTTRMKFIFAIIAAIIVATMAQNQEGGPQPDADAEAGTRHFGYGYGYNGYPIFGSGYHYPNYGYAYVGYPYSSGYGGYRPHGCYDMDVSSETERT